MILDSLQLPYQEGSREFLLWIWLSVDYVMRNEISFSFLLLLLRFAYYLLIN